MTHTNAIATTPQERTRARRRLGIRHNCTPVAALPGSYRPPTRLGEPGYWTTPSGKTIVRHPNAYGWPTVYHCSSERIVVGEYWLRPAAAPKY